MKVAVTGGSGHVGANLVRELINQGREVRALVRKDVKALEGLDVERIPGEVTDKASLLKCFKGADTVFHAAAMVSIDSRDAKKVYQTNINGPRAVVEACLECGVKRLVHFSSIHAFSSYPEGRVIDESSSLALGKKHFCYDRSKALGQNEILKGVDQGLDAVVLNPAGVLGPHDYKLSRMGSILLDIYHGRLPMFPSGGYNWVDARDVVQGALAAEEKGRAGECYLLTGHWASFSELAALVARCTGKKTARMEAPLWTAAMAAPFAVMKARISGMEPRFTPMAVRSVRMHRYISHMKATDELGYRPRPLEETVRDTLQWFRIQGKMEDLPN